MNLSKINFHSNSNLSSFTKGSQRSIVLRMTVASSSGELELTSNPRDPSLSRVVGLAKALAISRLKRLIINFGVLAGAIRLCHCETSIPNIPDSDSVGISGSIVERFLVVTASILTFPVR
jgi:hypothetical protein